MSNFAEKYGKWAIIAGGSEGIGGAYSTRAAEQGMNVVVIGRREAVIEKKRKEVEDAYGIKTRGIVMDMSDDGAWKKIADATADIYDDVGMLVYNAIYSIQPTDCWLRDPEQEKLLVNCNILNNMCLNLHYLKGMKERGRGALVLVSSMSGTIGSPYVMTYSASKAWINAFSEALWGELDGTGVDVLSVIAGPTIGQQFKTVAPGTPGFMTGDDVAVVTFESLGHGPYAMAVTPERKEMCAPYFDPDVRRGAVVRQREYIKTVNAALTDGENAKLKVKFDKDDIPTN